MSDEPEFQCPELCPNRRSSEEIRSEIRRMQRIGHEVATIALILFIGVWVARGWFERKTPSGFEIGFALACIYLARTDPKNARILSAQAVGRVLAIEPDKK